jgi:hypothetical protein
MNKKLMRFDVRLPKEDYASEFWDKEYRDRFLLEPDIEWPISVDPLVWPSIFFSKIFRDATKLSYGSIEVDPSIDNGEYWLNLEQMKHHYAANKLPNSKGVFVCIHLFSEAPLDGFSVPYLQNGIQCGFELHDTTPREAPKDAVLLGYDVADASWISGLTNCSYTPEDKERLSSRWLPRLNHYGLLRELDDARKFREVCNLRVPDHAPFWVFRISEIS